MADAAAHEVLLDAPPCGLGVAGPVPRGCARVDEKVAVAISGQPRWRDPAFASLAAQSGDAAALSAAYERGSERLFAWLEGSFALAVLDRERQRLLLAVDRMGIEPLCYAITPHGTVFARSATAVAAHPAVGASLDPQSVYDYLYFHVVPSPQTIFTGVRKLEPGQFLQIAGGKPHLEHYWRFEFARTAAGSEADLGAELLALLDQAVRERCDQGSTGAFLSGGIDSSTVSGMLSRLAATPTPTYTIGFSAQGYDEVEYARITSRHFQTRQQEYYVTPEDVAGAVSRIAAYYDEPFGNSSAVPVYYCAKLAREHGTQRMLAGDGGDELFGGNSRYAKQNVFEWYYRCPRWLRERLLEPALSGDRPEGGMLGKLHSYIQQARVPLPDRLQSYNYFSRTPAQRILHPDLLPAVAPERPLEELRAVYARAPSDNAINCMLFLDWKITLADNDLRKVSRMCELAGVAVSYPWLDDRVVEFSTRLPGSWKVRGTQLRYFVKRALRGFLPARVIHKPKQGFGLPFGVWMATHPVLGELARDSLSSLRRRGLVRPEYIDELLRQHRDEHAHYYGEFVWVLMMLELWMQSRESTRSTAGSALSQGRT